jgi:hypothetical protein
MGLYFVVGLKATISFFIKKGTNYLIKGKIKGSLFFFGGFIILLIFKLAFIGFLLQLFGIFTLFRSFFPFLYESSCNIPVIGRYLSIFNKVKDIHII